VRLRQSSSNAPSNAARATNVTRATRSGAAAGFSLLEMLIAIAILGVVTGAVFEQISTMQKKSQSEAMKLDLSQQSREFLDQTVRDLHMAGYPKSAMYANMPDNTDNRVAAGLVAVSPASILMEGDVNSEGQVYSVKIVYVPVDPADAACPCLRRFAVPKTPGNPLAQPTATNYTETTQVLPPGIGPGLSGEDLFAFYDMNGNPVDVTAGADISTSGGQATIASIKTIKINLSLGTNLRDPASGGLMRTSMSATARLNQ